MISLILLLPMALLAQGSSLGRVEGNAADFAEEWINWPTLDVVEGEQSSLDLAEGNGDSRIIGGTDADGTKPYQVSLQMYKKYHVCGGSIITKYWILTAAHCIYKKPRERYTVVMDILRLSDSAKGVRRKCAEFKPHENYNSVTLRNDIGGIKVDKEMEFTDNVAPIPLAMKNPADHQVTYVSGWGYTSFPKIKVPDHLQQLYQKIVAYPTCKALLKFLGIPAKNMKEGDQLCALSDEKEGHGACKGDSGSPMVIRGTVDGNGTVQIGVLSFGQACAKGVPDVYTSVANYLPWIQKNCKE